MFGLGSSGVLSLQAVAETLFVRIYAKHEDVVFAIPLQHIGDVE